MSLQTIQLNGQTVEIAPMPASPAPRMVEPWISDPIAESVSPWTGQTQRQRLSSNDTWGLTVTMPPIRREMHGAWIGWLMAMRGKQRAVWMPDPLWQPVASALRSSVPVVDGSNVTLNLAGATKLQTKGWRPNATRLLEPGDQFSLGARLYRVLFQVNADANGNAAFEVWPSLREQPADATPLTFSSLASPQVSADTKVRGPLGLFALAENKRAWSGDVTRLLRLSFQLKEYR